MSDLTRPVDLLAALMFHLLPIHLFYYIYIHNTSLLLYSFLQWTKINWCTLSHLHLLLLLLTLNSLIIFITLQNKWSTADLHFKRGVRLIYSTMDIAGESMAKSLSKTINFLGFSSSSPFYFSFSCNFYVLKINLLTVLLLIFKNIIFMWDMKNLSI